MKLALYIIVNLTYIFTEIWILSRIMDKRERLLWLRIIVSVILALGQSFVSLFQITWLNMFTTIFLLIASTLIIFKPAKYYFLLYDTLITVSMFAADLFASLSISAVSKNSIISTLQQKDIIILRYLLNCILAFTLCNIAFSFIKKKHTDYAWYEVIIYTMLAIAEVAASAYIVANIGHSSTGVFMILFLSGCFILDIYIVLVFDRISKSRHTEKANALLQQQAQMQLSVYRDLKQRYEQSVKIVHDVKKHINALEGLIKSENLSRAAAYKNNMYDILDKFQPSFKDSNELLSVIINHAILRTEQNNIKMHIQIENIDLSFISDIDLTTIISNIIDNALEAVSELPDNKREIWFVIEKRMGCILIHSENPYNYVEDISPNKYKSTKRGHMGIGLTNIESTVKKYGGIFTAENDNGRFSVSVTFPQI